MTHDDQSTRFEELLQLLGEHGFDGMSEAIEILMNEAMKLQRADALGAMPYQRSESRRGYANGFKPKTVNSGLGRLSLKVPQTRDVEFYPSALERGERSERALKLAVAEMYVLKWIRPKTLVSTNYSDGRKFPDGVNDYNSVLDFVFVSGAAKSWDAESHIMVRAGDFPDTDITSDHRPVAARIDVPD